METLPGTLTKLTISGLADDFYRFTDSDSDERFCFVVGAGASISSGIKSGAQLVATWENELVSRRGKKYVDEWKARLKITDDNRFGHYGDYYAERFAKPRDGYDYLERLMRDKVPGPGYVALAYILCRTRNNIVITTNFDHLIEDSVNYYENKFPLVIGHEAVAHYIEAVGNRPTIIKIHHDLLMEPQNLNDETNKLIKEWEPHLDVIFRRYHPIFIGYAGNDGSLMKYLLDNVEKFKKDGGWQSPYWMDYDGPGKSPLGEMAAQFLEKSGGELVPFNDFDSTIIYLARRFDFDIDKAQEKIRNDADKRSKQLKEAAERFERSFGRPETCDPAVPEGTSDPTGKNEPIKSDTEEVTVHSGIAEMDTKKTASPDELWKDFVLLYNSGDYVAALDKITALTELKPDDMFFTFYLSSVLCNLGKYYEAIEPAKKVVEFSPDWPYSHYNLSQVLYKLEKYDEALAEADKAYKIDPYYSEYSDWLKELKEKTKRKPSKKTNNKLD